MMPAESGTGRQQQTRHMPTCNSTLQPPIVSYTTYRQQHDREDSQKIMPNMPKMRTVLANLVEAMTADKTTVSNLSESNTELANQVINLAKQ
eukprot:3484032-Ditylum_brightwellii.AAC.1